MEVKKISILTDIKADTIKSFQKIVASKDKLNILTFIEKQFFKKSPINKEEKATFEDLIGKLIS